METARAALGSIYANPISFRSNMAILSRLVFLFTVGPMSAEERWANQEEWKNERGELEINDEQDVTGKGEICHFKKCGAPAVTLYEIKKAGAVGHGFDVLFCSDHDHEESAFDLYRDFNHE